MPLALTEKAAETAVRTFADQPTTTGSGIIVYAMGDCSRRGIASSSKKSYSLSMLGRLLLLFTIVPLAELYILIKIGGYIGGFNTILLVLMTAMLGASLARLQGLRTLQQIQLTLSQGQIPAEEMIDGVLILLGGILLLTPGVLTDLFALVLLFPYTRTYFKRWLRRRFDKMVAAGSVRIDNHRYGSEA